MNNDTSCQTKIIRWEDCLFCPLYDTYVKVVCCESCQHGFLGNYYLKQTLCGYDSSHTTKKPFPRDEDWEEGITN